MNFNIYNKGDCLKKEGYTQERKFSIQENFRYTQFFFHCKRKINNKKKRDPTGGGLGRCVVI
jgi:hypothetical protein